MTCEIAILALDPTPMRTVFLNALLQSARLHADLDITLIGDPARLPAPTERMTVRRPEEVLGVDMPWDLPPWYHEQLLALTFAATCRSDFALVLPIGSFVLRPLAPEVLAPRSVGRAHWEDVALHPEWWANARTLTRRRPVSRWQGPSILPALFSRELAAWTLDIVRRENGAPAVDVLIRSARAGVNWSAATLYATAAGSRLLKFHFDPYDTQFHPLLSKTQIWSQDAVDDLGASEEAKDEALLTFVQVSAISNADPILDWLHGKMALPGRTAA